MILKIILLTFFLVPVAASAHPGNTASDGCHYCRTRCDYWGETWNARHCHGGYAAPVPTTPTCPANAYYSGGTCVCKVGYNAFQGSCVRIPANAHAVNSSTDAWECNMGYIERNGGCIKVVAPKEEKKEVEEKSEPQVEQKEQDENKKEESSGLSDEQLETIKNYVEELEQENTDSTFGSFLSMAAIAIGGFMAYKKFKK